MEVKRLADKLDELLKAAEGKDVSLSYLRTELRINPDDLSSWSNLRVLMHNRAKQKTVKPSGRNDGVYKVLIPVEPVKWWDINNEEPLAGFRFPRSYKDNTTFGIEDLVEVFAGDAILITGVSNYGKTIIAISLMGENLDLFHGVLMGSEYTAADGKISPKFKRRLNQMDWVQWITEDGKPRFTLLPVGSDYEDYIIADKLNVIDWISLPGEYYLIDRVMKSIKDRIGNGVVAMVLQKNRASEFGEGGERTERYADVVLRIDPFGEKESLLTIGKVKAPKGKATGRAWAFEITDYGANLLNIREVVKCLPCKGTGFGKGGPCDACLGKGKVDKGQF